MAEGISVVGMSKLLFKQQSCVLAVLGRTRDQHQTTFFPHVSLQICLDFHSS